MSRAAADSRSKSNRIATLNAATPHAGISIPGETAVIGFDDDTPDSRDIIFPGLSTMRQPMYEMGCAAVELLLAVIRDPAHQPETRCFQPQLILRETCK